MPAVKLKADKTAARTSGNSAVAETDTSPVCKSPVAVFSKNTDMVRWLSCVGADELRASPPTMATIL